MQCFFNLGGENNKGVGGQVGLPGRVLQGEVGVQAPEGGMRAAGAASAEAGEGNPRARAESSSGSGPSLGPRAGFLNCRV